MAYLKTKSGLELTPEVTDKIAEEAEAGYDLTNARLISIGRPSLNVSGESRTIQVRVNDALDVQVRAMAKEQDRTVSELVRDALRQYVTPND
jgi:hypothetical protein